LRIVRIDEHDDRFSRIDSPHCCSSGSPHWPSLIYERVRRNFAVSYASAGAGGEPRSSSAKQCRRSRVKARITALLRARAIFYFARAATSSTRRSALGECRALRARNRSSRSAVDPMLQRNGGHAESIRFNRPMYFPPGISVIGWAEAWPANAASCAPQCREFPVDLCDIIETGFNLLPDHFQFFRLQRPTVQKFNRHVRVTRQSRCSFPGVHSRRQLSPSAPAFLRALPQRRLQIGGRAYFCNRSRNASSTSS